MQVASNNDWVIDIGPKAGDKGRVIVAQGKPSEVAQSEHNRTAAFLKSLI